MGPGDLVDGRFEIEAIAGRGAMGTVYRCRDHRTGGPVAVKVIDDTPDERFLREVRVLAELTHPAAVRYVAHGRLGESVYVAMEWLEGVDLDQRLASGPLGVAESVELARQVAGALGEAHRRRIVHRDVKPANIFLVGGDPASVKLLDFGVAHLAAATIALTRPGSVIGTPAYMAPEQARGDPWPGPTADVWSLGCVLFECLTGRPPFEGSLAMAVLAKVLLDEPPTLRSVAPSVPRALSDAVARMLERDPSRRPPDGAAVASLLEALDEESRTTLRRPQPSTGPREVLTRRQQDLIAVALAPAPEELETLAPEQGLALGDALSAIGRRHGTTVHVIGDGSVVMVSRGAGQAIDLAVSAARCALELHATVGLDRPMALAIGRARVEEQLPAGEVVDRAARLIEATGRRAGVWLDELTAGLLPPRFDIREEAAGLALAGESDESVPARTLLGRATPFVGRDKELRLLEATLDACIEEPSSQAVLIVGPAGMGKSRLAHELMRRAKARAPALSTWIGRGEPNSDGSPFALVSRALAGAFGIQAGQPLERRRERVCEHVARHVPVAERVRVAEFVGELVSADFPEEESVQLRAARRDPQLMGDQLARAFLDLLRAETRAAPLLLVLEDLHWGDLPSVRLIERALSALEEQPLFVIAMARPEVDERFGQLWQAEGLEQLHLRPLSKRACRSMAHDVLGPNLDEQTVDRLVTHADGNAFFLEELLRAEAEGRGGELPATLLAVAQARLETLDADARRILRAASAAGRAFSRGCLSAMLGEAALSTALGPWLDALVRGELLSVRVDPRSTGEQEYTFRHDLVREAAYLMLTDGDRTLAHRLMAEWLESVGDGDPVAIAEHHERGGEALRAVPWWHRAAENAIEASDLEAAFGRVERGVLCGAEGELLGRLRLTEAEARLWSLEYETAFRAAGEAMALLPAGSGPWCAASAQVVGRGVMLGKVDVATAAAQQLLAAARGSAQLDLALALTRVASNLLLARQEELSAAVADAARRMAAELAPDPLLSAAMHTMRAREAILAGDIAASVAEFRQSRAHLEEAGDLRRTLVDTADLGAMLLELGDDANAEAELRTALERAEEHGLRRVASTARYSLAWALARLGRLDEARVLQTRAVEDFRASGDRRFEAAARIYLASILMAQDALPAAAAEANDALRCAADVPTLRPFALGMVASVALARGDVAGALGAAREAVAMLEEKGAEEGEATIRLAFAEALHAAGSSDEARLAIATARDRIVARAERIGDAAQRRGFLERVPENRRTLERARQWLG